MSNYSCFKYGDLYCEIKYYEQDFYLVVFNNEDRTDQIQSRRLFPVERYSRSQEKIAFHVANLHVLPNII